MGSQWCYLCTNISQAVNECQWTSVFVLRVLILRIRQAITCVKEHLPTHMPTGLWATWQGACPVSFCSRSAQWWTSLLWYTCSINCPLVFEGAWWEDVFDVSGRLEPWVQDPSLHVQLCLYPAFSIQYLPAGLYLGRVTAKNDNARARANYPGARTEWAWHTAAPGLTVSACLETWGPQGAHLWLPLGKYPEEAAFCLVLSWCHLQSQAGLFQSCFACPSAPKNGPGTR